MRICPACGNATAQLNIQGWILKIDGSVILGEDGEVTSVSPLSPTVMVKAGKEVDSQYISAVCPECGFKAKFNQFKPVTVCWITQNPATVTIDFPGIGPKHLAESVVDIARLEAILMLVDSNPFNSQEELFHV